MGKENRDRLLSLRKEMSKRGIDAALVFTSDEHGSEYIDDHYGFREYLSGFTGSAGSLLITQNEAGLWTDGRYYIQAEAELKGSGISLHRSGEKGVKDIFEYTQELAKDLKKCGKVLNIGTDLRLMDAGSYLRLKKMCEKHGCTVTDSDLCKNVWSSRPDKRHKEIYALKDDLSGRSVTDKLCEIRGKLDEYAADAVIISDLSDVMWVFNIRGDDIVYNPVAESYGFVDKNTAFLFADLRYISDELKDTLKTYGVDVRDLAGFDDHIRDHKDTKVLCDLKTLNAHVYRLINEKDVLNRPSWNYIRKHLKNECECRLARDFHKKDGLAVTRFIYRIKKLVKESRESGQTINEHDAALLLDNMRYEITGNRGLSFETIAAYGDNAAMIHYSPAKEGSRVLIPEGFLLVDSGGQYDGATTDVTRTIALGPLTDEMKSDYTAVLKGMLDLADAVFLDGTRGENLDILARRPVWERYIDYRHGTGHGVGAMLNVHEGPQGFRYRINDKVPQPPLEPGMITSDEPGIYLEGKYGIRIENLLLCIAKENNEWGHFLGFDTLTMVPYERDAILVSELTERQKEIIDRYNSEIYKLYEAYMDEDEKKWLAFVTAAL
ncbi:MAG: aminopeptidase P family protein [Lachnospiraceae bacterium]|nr:aminopeptidase P family protein [Lachnospiraceae bacterium]